MMPYATVASQCLRVKAAAAGAAWSACRYLSRGRGWGTLWSQTSTKACCFSYTTETGCLSCCWPPSRHVACAVSHKQWAQPKPQGADWDTTILALSSPSIQPCPKPMRPSWSSPPEREMRGLGETRRAYALGLRLSQRSTQSRAAATPKELKVYLSIPQKTNGKGTGCWYG